MRTSWRFGLIALVGCGVSGEATGEPALDVGFEDVPADTSVADTTAADTATAADAASSDGGAKDASFDDAAEHDGGVDAFADADGALADSAASPDGAFADASMDADGAVADSATSDSRVDSVADSVADSAADSAADSVADSVADSGADSGGVDGAVAAGPITGGPCSSGAIGATAFRLRWAGSGAGSTAYVVYEVEGLPDNSSLKAGAYGYSFGYKPTFDDPFLGVGGLVLDSSGFVDIDFSTVGITSIKRATLSIKGRSFNTTASGSYSWQTFDGGGATPSGAVANSAPYAWYGPLPFLGSSGPIGDATAAIKPGKTTKLRLKAGPPSGSLIVNSIELCLEAT